MFTSLTAVVRRRAAAGIRWRGVRVQVQGRAGEGFFAGPFVVAQRFSRVRKLLQGEWNDKDSGERYQRAIRQGCPCARAPWQAARSQGGGDTRHLGRSGVLGGRRVRSLYENQVFPLAHERPAFPRLPPAVG